MCRAVLDAEFQAEIPADDVVAWWATTARGRDGERVEVNFASRIHAAEYTHRIPHEVHEHADWVRRKGNDMVHREPDANDSQQAVNYTVEVLETLGGAKAT